MTLLFTFKTETILFKAFSFGLFLWVPNLSSDNFYWDNLISFMLIGAIRDVGMPFSLFSVKVVVVLWSKGFFDNGKVLDFVLHSIFPFVNHFGPVFFAVNSSGKAFVKSISKLCYSSNLSTQYLSFFEKVLKFGNIFINEIAFYLKFVKFGFGLFNSASMGKGISEEINEITP
jgi:hypothetical protein